MYEIFRGLKLYDELNGRTIVVDFVRNDSKTAQCSVTEYGLEDDYTYTQIFTFTELNHFKSCY